MLTPDNMCSHSQETPPPPQGKTTGKGFPNKQTNPETSSNHHVDTQLCWLILATTWHKLESPKKRKPQMKNCLHQIGLGTCLWSIFLVNDCFYPPSPRRVVPPLGRWSGLHKEAGWVEVESKAVCIIPLWSLLQVLPWDLALACLDDGL